MRIRHIRHYGLLCNSHREQKLAVRRELLDSLSPSKPPRKHKTGKLDTKS